MNSCGVQQNSFEEMRRNSAVSQPPLFSSSPLATQVQHMTERLLEINPQIRPGPEEIDSNEIDPVTLLNLSAPPPQQTTELFEFRVAQVKLDPSERDEYLSVADGEILKQNGVVLIDSLAVGRVASDVISTEKAITTGTYTAEEIFAGGDGGEGYAGI